MIVLPPITYAMVAKLPDDIELSKEDLNDLMMRIGGISVNEKSFIQFQEKLSKFNGKRTALEKIVNPFFSWENKGKTKESKKKDNELVQLAQFMLALNENVEILEAGERPDFVVGFNKHRIGVEIVQLYNEDVVKIIGDLKGILGDVERHLLAKYTGLKKLINVLVTPHKIVFKGKRISEFAEIDRKEFATQVCQYLEKHLLNEEQTLPSYIEHIVSYTHKHFCVTLAEKYIQKTLTKEKVLDAVKKKEKKLIEYKQLDNNIQYYWLLMIVSGGSNASSFTIPNNILDQLEYDSMFAQMFIYDVLKQNIYISKGQWR